MEEISSTVAVPFTLGNLIQKESVVTTHMEITGLKLMANTASAAFILNPGLQGCNSFSVGSENNHTDVSSQHHISISERKNQLGGALVSEMFIGYDKNRILPETHNQASKKDEFLLAVNFQCADNSSSQSVVTSDCSSISKGEYATLSNNCSWMDPLITTKVEDNIHANFSLNESVQNMVSASIDFESEDGHGSYGSDPKPCAMLLEAQEEKKIRITSSHNALELSSGPLCGFSSICGRRQEMEDAIAVKPKLMRVSSKLLIDNHVNENTKYSEVHFFGVYDGHGGCQVANYCRENLHSVLIKEIEAAESSFCENNGVENWQDHWKKAFSNCFHKVDDEVSGNRVVNIESSSISDGSESSSIEPLAPETVGSTAVVAILSQTHVIVANCGDSRAVLCRGKEALPLSADHKPNREDEWARIEAAGGRVIQWNGYRVLGVSAVSRSIGDRYLKPWIISDSEVKFVHREKNDECLILASDGLWDVMTNEEACDIARKRILLWHKKYGNDISITRDEEIDPAAHSAAEYLSRLAFQRGSKDNISVIVIDLKAQRKIKRKA